MSNLLTKGSEVFPERLIAEDGYSSTPNMQSDKNSFTDGDGKLHRTILPHTRSKVRVELLDMSQVDKIYVQSFFPSRSNVDFDYWNDEDNMITPGVFYIPDIEFKIKSNKGGVKVYRGFAFEMIEY